MTQFILTAIRSFGDLQLCSNGVSIELRESDAYKCGRNLMQQLGMHRELHDNYAGHQHHFRRVPDLLVKGYNVPLAKINERCTAKNFNFRIINSGFEGTIRTEDFVTVVMEIMYDLQNPVL